MTKINLPHLAGKQPGPTMFLTLTTRVLFAFCIVHSSVAVVGNAQARTDNRRLFWTGSNGAVWDTTTASWMTSGSFLAYADSGTNSAVWLDTIPGTGAPVVADPAVTFLGGDVAIFDSYAGLEGWVPTGTTSWSYIPPYPNAPVPDPTAIRTIEIASGGVKVSDVVLSGPGSFVFTGGAITADPSFIAPGSVQVTGTGAGYAANYVRPTGSLIKRNTGVLTLSNTAASHFPGGIHLMTGTLSIADPRALGNNNIITNYIVTAGNAIATSNFYGDILLAQIHRPGIPSGGNLVPAVVLDSGGRLLTNVGASVSLHVAPSAGGLDITGDIYISSRVFEFNIEGETTISGRILSNLDNYGATNGTIVKTGTGTLILSGTQNWFHTTGGSTSQILDGRLVATTQYAIGTGPFSIEMEGVLEFRGATGTFRQAFRGGGKIDITQGSDITFNWRDGVLSDFDTVPSAAPANNDIKSIIISGASRFAAIASGTYSSVLGGAGVYINVTEGSTLVLGREGISNRGTGGAKIPMTYAILAGRIDLAGSSTLILNPNAYLSAGALVASDATTTCAISFGGSGVSRLRWQEGVDPDTITMDPNDASARVRYIIPDGMDLLINTIPVPVSPQQSIPADNSSSGWCREYVVVNQGANPLNDIALTLDAISAAHDAITMRLADDFLDPVTRLVPSRGRKWVNNAWARYSHSEIEYDTGAGNITPGVDGKTDVAVAGLNGILPGRVLLGFYGGMADNSLDTTNDTNLASKQRFIGVHAAQKLGKFHISIDATTGRVRTDAIRHEPTSIIRGKWDTSYYSGALQIGALFSPWQKIMLKPYAGLRYSKMKLSKYDERGASPLMIGDFDDACAQVIYGLAASRKFAVFKRTLAVDLSLGRKQMVSAPRATLDTYFYDAPTTLVQLKRGDYYSSLTTLGLSARMAMSTHTQVGIACEYETSSSRTNATCSALVSYSW